MAWAEYSMFSGVWVLIGLVTQQDSALLLVCSFLSRRKSLSLGIDEMVPIPGLWRAVTRHPHFLLWITFHRAKTVTGHPHFLLHGIYISFTGASTSILANVNTTPYVHIHILYIHIYVFTHTHTRTRIHMYIYIYVQLYARKYTWSLLLTLKFQSVADSLLLFGVILQQHTMIYSQYY